MIGKLNQLSRRCLSFLTDFGYVKEEAAEAYFLFFNILIFMPQSDPFANSQNVLITGGSSGIGKSCVERFVKSNYQVATVDRQEAQLPEEVIFVKADLSLKESIAKIQAALKEADFQPDILILNAGKGIHQSLTEGDPDEWEYIFQLNVLSTLRMIRAFVPAMAEKGQGDVFFVTSVSARHPYPYGGVYAATKAALEVIAETLRLEQQPHIRVSRILPGVVDTAFFNEMIDGQQTPESIGWGALSPDKVAQTIFEAVNQPHEVALNEIVIRPVAQPM